MHCATLTAVRVAMSKLCSCHFSFCPVLAISREGLQTAVNNVFTRVRCRRSLSTPTVTPPKTYIYIVYKKNG